MFFAEQNVCQTKLWPTSGFLRPGPQSFLRFPVPDRTPWLVLLPSMWQLGGKGQEVGVPSPRHSWWFGDAKRSQELLWFHFLSMTTSYHCTSRKEPMCFPRHSVEENSSRKGRGEIIQNSSKSGPFLPQPHKRSFFKVGKSHTWLSNNRALASLIFNCPPDSLLFMTVVQLLTFPLNRWTEASWLLHFKTISITS